MSSEERIDQAVHPGVVPVNAEAKVLPAEPAHHEDRELSDKELEKVSGGVWRNGRWYAK